MSKSRHSNKGRSKKRNAQAADVGVDREHSASESAEADSLSTRPPVPAPALTGEPPVDSAAGEANLESSLSGARSRQESGVEAVAEQDGASMDRDQTFSLEQEEDRERPSVPATPSARRMTDDSFLTAPKVPSLPSLTNSESSPEIRVDEAAILDPSGDDDDYAKTPIASIKNFAPARAVPSLRPNIIPPATPGASGSGLQGTDAPGRPRRDTMVGFPAPPAAAPLAVAPSAARLPSVPAPSAGSVSKPFSLPPPPAPPRSSGVPAPPPTGSSSGAPLRAGSLPPAPSSVSRIPIPPLPISSSALASSPPNQISSRPSAPPPIYAAPVAPPPSRRPELPVNSVYEDEDEDEVTSVFSAGSQAAIHLGGLGVSRSTPPTTPPAAPGRTSVPAPISPSTRPGRTSVPAPLSRSVSAVPPIGVPPGVAPARSAITARPPSARDQKTSPPGRLSAPPPVSSIPAPSYQRYAPASIRRKSNLGRWAAVIGGFAVAAAILFLLFVPRTGTLVITVAKTGALPIADLEIFVDGQKRCSATPCNLSDLTSGSHLVRARAKGFEPTAEQAIVVVSGRDVAHNFTLSPAASLKSGLEVATGPTGGPAGTKVFVDGIAHGTLPLSLKDLEPRQYVVRLDAGERFEPYEQRVTLKPGDTTKLDTSGLVLKRGRLTLTLPKEHKGARVTLDGKLLRKFPVTFELDAKTPHQLSAKQRGYEAFQREIAFSASEPDQQLAIELESPASKVNSAQVASAAASQQAASPASAVDSSPSRSQPAAGGQKSVFATAVSTESSAPAAAEFGTLNLNSIPSTTVIVNGRTMGRTPRMGLKVKAGDQSIVFVHPEKGRKQTQVTVPAGDTKTVAVRF